MRVAAVREGEVRLVPSDDGGAPAWPAAVEVQITCLSRRGVALIHVPVVRTEPTALVVAAPTAQTPVQRRAYVRIANPVPARGMLLDPDDGEWVPFDAEVRDLGGGGCAVLAAMTPPDHSTVVIAFAVDEASPVVVVGRVLARDPLPTIGKPMTRVEFVLIREADRDRILRFVLAGLAVRRRAELGDPAPQDS